MRQDMGEAPGPGFGRLREDAVRLLAGSPAGLDAGALARALFGTEAGDRWVPLLATVLASDNRLRQDDGRWHLARRAPARQPATPALPLVDRATTMAAATPTVADAAPEDDGATVVALALVTTGADPRRHRIARIAVIRREQEQVTARFDMELGGEWWLGRRGGPDGGQVDDDEMLTFADVLPALRELVDGRLVYAYGARRAAAFLEAEQRRVDVPGLEAGFREVDDLLRQLLPNGRKPGLLAAADELGIPGIRRESPLAEADLVARVVERVRQRLAASPARLVLDGPDEMTERPGPLPFTDAWLAGVPEGPGVYLLEDAAGQTLYVGKAVALRRRLADYVSKQPSLHRRFEALGVRATAVQTIETASDLEATLLEARLIRERQPQFNTARTTRGPAWIVRAAPDDTSPRVQLVGAARADGARYFGPFESSAAARQALAVARAAYPAAFERRRGDRERQRQAVLTVCQLLAGQKHATVELLRRAMQDAAAAGDRSDVDRLRATLRSVQTLDMRPSPLVGLAVGWRLLALEWLWDEGPRRLHLIEDGRLVGSAETDELGLPHTAAALTRLVAQTFGQTERPESWSADDTAILLRWLVQARQRVEVARLPTLLSDDRDC